MRTRWLQAAAGAALAVVACSCAGDETSGPVPDPTTTPSTAPNPIPSSSATSSTAPADDPTGAVITGDQLRAIGWRSIQAPLSENVRYVAEGEPLGGASRPPGPLLRFDLAPGELYGAAGEGTSRAEVYGRVSAEWSDPPASWPDPPGSQRWFTFSLYLPRGFRSATDPAQWLDLTQWKGRDGGSPPLAVEVTGSSLRLGGTRANAGALPHEGDLGPLPIGTWTTLTVGIRFSPDDDGWIEVFRDGASTISRTPLSTMDTIAGQPDPVYLKQGIYRSQLWTTTQTVYFSPVTVTEDKPSGLP